MEDKFMCLYKEVFNQDGEIMRCGRSKCKELIITARAIDNSRRYGDNNGFMNVNDIKALYRRLAKSA